METERLKLVLGEKGDENLGGRISVSKGVEEGMIMGGQERTI